MRVTKEVIKEARVMTYGAAFNSEYRHKASFLFWRRQELFMISPCPQTLLPIPFLFRGPYDYWLSLTSSAISFISIHLCLLPYNRSDITLSINCQQVRDNILEDDNLPGCQWNETFPSYISPRILAQKRTMHESINVINNEWKTDAVTRFR